MGMVKINAKTAKVIDRHGYGWGRRGTWYLAAAAQAAAEADRYVSLSKELYPAIAKANGTDVRAVERAVRTAIRAAGESMTAGECIHALGREIAGEN